MNEQIQRQPKPMLEWIITDLCNFQCPYCSFPKAVIRYGHCPDARIEKVFQIIEKLEGGWLIKLIGGEPMFHPRFLDLCTKIRQSGHILSVNTNFSVSEDKIKEFLEASGESLTHIMISLHESQVRDLDGYISNIVFFRDHKRPQTSFSVASVVTEENFERLKEIDERLNRYGLSLRFQVLKRGGHLASYAKPIEEYIADRTLKNLDKIRTKSFRGCMCYAGKYYFRVAIDGRVYRCNNFQPHYYLGSIDKGTFKPLKDAIPCLSKICTCTTYVNRNMICPEQKSGRLNYLYWDLRGRVQNLPLQAHYVKKYFLKKAKKLGL